MELKPGYKQTEVGVIPEDWDSLPMTALVEPATPIRYGVVQVGADTNGGVPVVAIKYVKEIASAPLHRVAKLLESPYAKSRVRGGDVLISIKGTIGRVGIVPDGFEGNISRELARIRPKSIYAGSYLAQQLEATRTQARISKAVVGTTRLEFSIAELKEFEIPIPNSRDEQDAIAATLSDVDALIASLDKLIAKKDDIKQATMHQLLTGKRRLPGFCAASGKAGYKQTEVGVIPVDWDIDFVVNLAAITTGDKNTQDRIEDGAYPFFVRSSTVERINSYTFDGEAVLTAGDGVGTGKIFHYVNGKFDFHQRVYSINNFCAQLDGYFFYLYFSASFFSRIMQMTAKSSVDSVRREMIANMRIPVPPLAEQKAIATVIADMDAEITTLVERREKTLAIKQGMMQELLTGRIRLV